MQAWNVFRLRILATKSVFIIKLIFLYIINYKYIDNFLNGNNSYRIDNRKLWEYPIIRNPFFQNFKRISKLFLTSAFLITLQQLRLE